MPNQAPIFIIGNPRSGTTLFRVILNAHSQIVIPPECGFAVWLYEKYRDWNSNLLDNYLEELARTKKFETWNLDFAELTQYMHQVSPKTYKEVVDNIYTFYALQHSTTFAKWGDKNNFYLNHIPSIREIFPDAIFLHIIRDGRDVACSYKELAKKQITSTYAPKLPIEIDVIAEEWKLNNETILSELEKSSNTLTIRYEDLVLEAENTLKTVCAFVGLQFEPKMLLFYKNSSKTEPADFMQWKQKINQTLDETSINRYKQELALEEIKIFNDKASLLLNKYGYI